MIAEGSFSSTSVRATAPSLYPQDPFGISHDSLTTPTQPESCTSGLSRPFFGPLLNNNATYTGLNAYITKRNILSTVIKSQHDKIQRSLFYLQLIFLLYRILRSNVRQRVRKKSFFKFLSLLIL